MKKYSSIVLALMLVVALFGLVACEVVPGEQHTHTFAKEWTMSETEHWHVATCEHTTEESDRAPHEFNAEVTKKVTDNEDGEVVYTCKVCGYSKKEVLSHESHEHVIGWTTNRTEHTQAYICCDAKLDNPQHGEHVYTDGATCTICQVYSVVEDAREQLNKGVFSYSLVVNNINLNLSALSEDNDDIVIKSGAFKVGLDENCMLTLVGTFAGVQSGNIETAEGVTDKLEHNVSGTIVIDNNKVYVISKTDNKSFIASNVNGSRSIEEYESVEGFAVYDLNKQFVDLGVEDFTGVVNMLLDAMYDYSDEIKAAVDKIVSIDDGDSFDKWFVKGEDGAYKLNFGVINDFNDKAKTVTVGKLISDLTGQEDYKKAVENIVKMVLGFKVGDILDLLEQQGVDIYEINDKINELVAKYNPGEEKTIEEILIAQGLPIPANAKLADLIDNKLTRAYTVLDIVNMIGNASASEENPFTPLTVSGIVEIVNGYVETYGEKTVYEVIAEVVSAILQSQEIDMTLTASNIYTAIDEVGKLLNDYLHISVVLNEGKVVSLSINVKYVAPATDETDSEETTEEPAEEDPLDSIIVSVMQMARQILDNFDISLTLNDSTVSVDVDAAIANAEKGISDAIPEGNSSVKKILEEDGFTDVEFAQKDGRDYFTAKKSVTENILSIYKNSDSDDHMLVLYTLSVGGYVDSLLEKVEYLDKCGNDFAARIDMLFDSVEADEITYRWNKSGDIGEEELSALRTDYTDRKDNYKLLYGELENSDTRSQIELIYDATTKTYAKCPYNAFDFSQNELKHTYELVSGSLEDVNENYYTKLVYKCKECGNTVTVYLKRSAQTETSTEEAA